MTTFFSCYLRNQKFVVALTMLLLQSCLQGHARQEKPIMHATTEPSVHPCLEGTDISGDAVSFPIKLREDKKSVEFLGSVLTTTGDRDIYAELNLRTKDSKDVPFSIREPTGRYLYISPINVGGWDSVYWRSFYYGRNERQLPKETIGRCFVTVIGGTLDFGKWPQTAIWIRDDGKHGYISMFGDRPTEVGGSVDFSYSLFFGYRGKIYFLQLPEPFSYTMVFARTDGRTTEVIRENVDCRLRRTARGFMMGGAKGCYKGDPGWVFDLDSETWTSISLP